VGDALDRSRDDEPLLPSSIACNALCARSIQDADGSPLRWARAVARQAGRLGSCFAIVLPSVQLRSNLRQLLAGELRVADLRTVRVRHREVAGLRVLAPAILVASGRGDAQDHGAASGLIKWSPGFSMFAIAREARCSAIVLHDDEAGGSALELPVPADALSDEDLHPRETAVAIRTTTRALVISLAVLLLTRLLAVALAGTTRSSAL